MPNLMLQGQEAGARVGFLPLITLTYEDLKTSLLNILLFVPFGFGLPFITNFRMKKIIILGALFSLLIEFIQLITRFITGITFRIADINDLIFNTIGSTIGFLMFVVLVQIIRQTIDKRSFSKNKKQISKKQFLQYIAERPQIK